MFETKPLTNADHFVRPAPRMTAVRRELPPSADPVIVTISPEALALLAAAQTRMAGAGEKDDRAERLLKRKLVEQLPTLAGESD